MGAFSGILPQQSQGLGDPGDAVLHHVLHHALMQGILIVDRFSAMPSTRTGPWTVIFGTQHIWTCSTSKRALVSGDVACDWFSVSRKGLPMWIIDHLIYCSMQSCEMQISSDSNVLIAHPPPNVLQGKRPAWSGSVERHLTDFRALARK